MREINKKELVGLWKIGTMPGCYSDEEITLFFNNNTVTINGMKNLNIFNMEYEIRDVENAKFLYLKQVDMIIELWMIMGNQVNSIIIIINGVKCFFEKIK